MEEELNSGAQSRVRFIIRSNDDPLRGDGPNVIKNLMCSPKRISSVYVYDKTGTELFERQCRTPEYYLRRAEARLLRSHAAEIVDRCGALPLVELGAGTADKTRTLLSEYENRGSCCDYFPIDVDTETLREAACRLAADFPGLRVHCLGTTYEHALCALPAGTGGRLFLFLGSSIGNMEFTEMQELLSQLHRSGCRGDYLLLGADLDKDPAVIDRAYNDVAGYGARSTLNMLSHLNRRYDGDFKPETFRYRSRYDPGRRKNEVKLQSLVRQTVTLAALGFAASFQEGELIDAEVMWKFDPEELGMILKHVGFSPVQHWIEPRYRYGLFLVRR